MIEKIWMTIIAIVETPLLQKCSFVLACSIYVSTFFFHALPLNAGEDRMVCQLHVDQQCIHAAVIPYDTWPS